MKTLDKVYVLDYHEFDEMVSLYLNSNAGYEVVAAMEWSNDQSHLFKVEPLSEKEKLKNSYYNKYTKREVEKFILDGKWKAFSLSPSDILEYLANETGDIEFGNYLIEVSW